MTRPRVYVDTNARIPYYLSDLFGFLATYSVIDLLWSDYLVDEILEVVARVHGPGSVKPRVAQWAALRAAFPEGEVTGEHWQSRIADASGVDDDDLPHQAAALAGGASVLVTSDRAGFPADGLARHGILVLTPDQCLVELLLDDPLRVARDAGVALRDLPKGTPVARRVPRRPGPIRCAVRARRRRGVRARARPRWGLTTSGSHSGRASSAVSVERAAHSCWQAAGSVSARPWRSAHRTVARPVHARRMSRATRHGTA